MKKSIIVTLTICIAFFNSGALKAQDIIHRKNGKTIEAKVLEITADDVKYKMFTQPNGVTITIDVALVKKIVFENGMVQKFDEGSSYDNKEYYEGQNRSAYKISFLSWTAGFTTLTYERNLKPGASIEARLGIIGAGRNEEINTNQKTNQRGAYIGFGYKFYNKPDYYTSRQHYGHLLKGGYIRPEINFGSYGVDYILYTGSSIPSKKRLTKTYGSLMVCVGKQWIFDNKFALDVFFGLGTGFTSSNKSQFTTGSGFIDVVDNSTTRYGNNIFPNNLAFNFGLNIGFLGK